MSILRAKVLSFKDAAEAVLSTSLHFVLVSLHYSLRNVTS